MNRTPLIVSFVLALALTAATVLYLRNTTVAILDPAGPIAYLERRVILVTLLLSGVVVIPVFIMLFSFSWRYRAGSPAAQEHHDADWDHDSRAAEIVWWLVPSFIIIVLSIVAWASSYTLDPYKPLPAQAGSTGEAPIEVQVVALDWKWLFMYPKEGIASVNMLELPVGTPVHFFLTADAPMNSFWIPQLGGQIMVMPGMSTQLYLRADKVGEYRGYSANISGAGFSGMTFTARAVSQDEFDAWVSSVRASSTPLDAAGYAALALPSAYNQVGSYALADQNLYSNILMRYMTPASSQSTNSLQKGNTMSGMTARMASTTP